MKTCPCVLTGTLTSPDKINGASRESVSTVNKAQLTATGNGLLLKFNSETPNLLQDGVYTPNQRHVTTDGFHEERCFYIHGASSPACGKFLKLMQRPLRQFVTTAWKSSLYRTGGAPRTYALRCRFAGLHKWLPSVLQTATICDAAKKIPKCPADYFHKDAKHTKSFLQLAITVDLIKWPDTGQEDSCCAGSVWGIVTHILACS